MSTPFIFYIRGMTCGGCASIIESALQETYSTRLELFKADVAAKDPKKTIIILADTDNEEHKITWEKIRARIEELSYNCEPYEYLPADEQELPQTELYSEPLITPQSMIQKLIAKGQALISSHWFQGVLGCSIGIAMLIAMLATGGLPLAAMIPLAGLSIVLTLVLGANSYYDAWKKLVNAQTLTMDSLFAISTLSVMAVSLVSFFVPWLPMMFEASLLIYGFRHIGIAIEDTIKEKISSVKFKDRAPKIVNLLLQNTIIKTPLFQIKPDDTLIVNPGEIVSVDGICKGETWLYNTITTGAILPRRFHPGDKIFAGMRVAEKSPPLQIQVTKPQKESYLARLDANIAQSLTQKTPLEIKTQQILTYFIPTVLGLAIASGIIVGLFFPPALAIQCAISVLVSACPCTLGLIIPLAVTTGVDKAAEHGIQFKKSRIQDPEQINTIVFDLNGTLTMGVPTVRHYSPLADTGISPAQLLNICDALEKESTHPIGKAIHSYTQKNCSQKNVVTYLDDSHHAGVSGTIDDFHYTIGSRTLMQKKGISTAAIEESVNLEAGDSLVFVARETDLIGYIIITDPLRKDAKPMIEALTQMGKDIILCTGADEKTAARYAKALGITKIHANSTATTMEEGDRSKPIFIQSLQNQGHVVAMVGDAANDAQALAVSDFGIAILSHDSDELTQQHAGAIIHSDSLRPIINIFAISQETVANINQNLFLSFAYNFISILLAGGLLLAVGVALPPALGVVFMALQACTILYNVYCFKNQPLEYSQNETMAAEETLSTESSSVQKINQHLPKLTISPPCESEGASIEKEISSEKQLAEKVVRSEKKDCCSFLHAQQEETVSLQPVAETTMQL
ncbi:heavy metal translocating P-type ATPase [Legionella fallonii]|uniref:Cation transporting ATPase PacS n=1 Tax=Legionella fallonii LLAP-10 TaxID=1212491 RepID=A0A098G025_9GAMM|nr:HAD-IC family P-type ATPase [Legionella fallonii]CEG55842.1 Cation transporting ATPase PacS [Legionella fallonii LLAP-10]